MKQLDKAIKMIDEDNIKRISRNTIQELEKLKSKAISVIEKNAKLSRKEEWGGTLTDSLNDASRRIKSYFDEIIGIIERNS